MEYGDLFEPSPELIRDRYLKMARTFHPDCCQAEDAKEKFIQLAAFKTQAEEDLKEGIWKKTGAISFQMNRGGWITTEYDSVREFELGQIYISADKLMYLIDADSIDLYENALKYMGKLSFATEGMKQEFINVFPRVLKQGKTKNGKGIILLEKSKDEHPLGDILEKLGGRMEARHVAWIISRLSSICCYLQYAGLVHNGLCIDNLFVNPGEHTISLYGGWWYTAREGSRMLGTTKDVYEIMSDRCKTDKLAECLTDQEMVHEIAKLLLNNKSLVFKAGESRDIPEAMASWIREGGSGDAYADFINWNRTLDISWGARQFVVLTVPGVS